MTRDVFLTRWHFAKAKLEAESAIKVQKDDARLETRKRGAALRRENRRWK